LTYYSFLFTGQMGPYGRLLWIRLKTMDGMDDQDVKDALEAMDRRNSRQQEEWQYPRYKPVDPAFAARIYRQMGRPYDASLIPEEEKHYIGGWDNGDDGDDATPQVKPAPNLFQPSQGGSVRAVNPWKLDWGPEGSPADRPKTPEALPGRYAGGGGFPFGNMGNNGGGLSGGQGVVNALAKPGSLAVTPLGLAKPGLGNAKPGDLVFGRDGVLRPYAEENALWRAVDRLTARVLEPRPEQGGAGFPGYGTVKNAFGNGPGGNNAATGFQPMSSNTGGKSYRPDPNLKVPGPKPPDNRLRNPLGERQKTSGALVPSEKLIGFLANYEKYYDKPYKAEKEGNWTIGFGHEIKPGEDFSNGISEEEAWKLLRKDVKEHADAIYQWVVDNNLKLTQQQFDALVSLRFNLGSLVWLPNL